MLGKLPLLALAALAAMAAQAPPGAPDPGGGGDPVYAALRRTPATRLEVGGGVIDVAFADGAAGLDQAQVLAWVRRSAQALCTYFGRFPVAHVGLLVTTEDSDRIHGGTTYGYDGPAIRITVGRRAAAGAFARDWILVHEMVHLSIPTVPRASLWLQEGEATYVEPIARAQAGQLDPAVVWMWAVRGLPQGQSPANVGGLDGTQDHGRIYWGGAMFWLLADIRIRERTHNNIGVQTALKAINAKSGGVEPDWPVARVLAAGDAATGGTELADLYAQVKDAPYPVDVAALLRALGVGGSDGVMRFDDSAPLAAIRRQITAPPEEPAPA